MTVDVTFGDSGDADNKAFETTVPKLQSEGVSAMIGAASSGVTKLFLDSNVSEGIITFSPANTSPDFTTWDDSGLYWRGSQRPAAGQVLELDRRGRTPRTSASSTRTTRTAPTLYSVVKEGLRVLRRIGRG